MNALKIIIEVFTQNPLTVTLAVFGVVCVALSIIGKVPPIELTPRRATALGGFGGLLILSSCGLAYLLAQSSIGSIAQQSPTSVPLTQTTAAPIDGTRPSTTPARQVEVTSIPNPTATSNVAPAAPISNSAPPTSEPVAQNPVSLRTIGVRGNDNTGEQVTAEKSGTYIFRYVSGSYSVAANKWLTSVFVYKGPKPARNGAALVQTTFSRIVDYGYFPSPAEAEAAGRQGGDVQIVLNQGDVLTLVAADDDDQPGYADNQGVVTLEILFTP